MSSVSVQQLNVRIDGNTILEGLDLSVAEGEFLVLLGPSGCGKSTLLHTIAGLTEADGGAIHIAGRDVTWADPKDRGVGMVFQSYALYPTMSVERNMSFALRVAGLPKDEIARRVARAAKLLQLEALLDRKPSQLSGGQRQRVAIGRALAREAKVYLFDEPLSNLDAKLRTDLRRELKQLHRELGATMVYVTHDQVEAMTLATRMAVMRGGRIQQIGTPAEVYAKPLNTFVAGFLGAPGMNFIEGRLGLADAAGIAFEGQGMRLRIPAAKFFSDTGVGAALLGVRPEHVSLAGGDAALRGTVDLVEPMGAHAVVWVDTPAGRLAAIAPVGREPRLGDSVGVGFDLDHASVFDKQTQVRL